MKTNALLLGIVLAVTAVVSGCTPVMQSGLPDPALTARDKQMMALAEPDEWKIPDVRSKVQYSTGEAPGYDRHRHRRQESRFRAARHKQGIQSHIAWRRRGLWAGAGEATAARMVEWPTWMPTASIMERWPEFQAYPLLMVRSPAPTPTIRSAPARSISTRAITTRSTRIHGTNEPSEIGQ